jgi:hypothetical protein
MALLSTPRAVLQTAGTLYGVGSVPTPYVYRLSDADQGSLARFAERYFANPGALDFDESAPVTPPGVSLAVKGYTHALFSGRLVSQVVFALGALEALLLRPAERIAANQRFLGQRLKTLLDACDRRFAQASTVLQAAYAVRNADRSGLQAVEALGPIPKAVARSMLEATRYALIVFSQLDATVDTASLVDALENRSARLRGFLNGIELPF